MIEHLSEVEWCTISQLEYSMYCYCVLLIFIWTYNYSFLIFGSNCYYEDHFTLETLS